MVIDYKDDYSSATNLLLKITVGILAREFLQVFIRSKGFIIRHRHN